VKEKEREGGRERERDTEIASWRFTSSSGALTRFVLSMDEHAATCWHERRGCLRWWLGLRKEDEE